MVPLVHALERPGPERPVEHDLAAGLLHLLAILRGNREGAHRVEQHVHRDAGPAPLGQGLRGLGRGRAFLEDVLGVGDALAGGADGRDLGREDLIAVQQHLDPVAADDGVAGVGHHGGPEGRLPHLERRQLQVGLHARAPAPRQQECQ